VCPATAVGISGGLARGLAVRHVRPGGSKAIVKTADMGRAKECFDLTRESLGTKIPSRVKGTKCGG